MKNGKYLLLGICFGIILTKGEAISWFRMQEMFHFQGFQMFGIFMTAIPTGMLSVFIIKKFGIKTRQGETVRIPCKKFHHGLWIGGLFFGFGWALTGACPGPVYAQIGSGFTVVIVTLCSALAGTWTYSYFKDTLPQ